MSIHELRPGDKPNLDTIIRAAKAGDLCVMRLDTKDGKQVSVICALPRSGPNAGCISPLAKLFDDNPYEELEPPL